jgi:alkane 1-monooxygenase
MSIATAPPVTAPLAQARFVLMNGLLVLNLVCLSLGGAWLWAGFVVAVLLATVADEAAGDDVGAQAGPSATFLNAMLFATWPLMLANGALYLTLWGSGDPLGLHALAGVAGVDLEAARAASGGWSLLGGALALGLFTGAAATNVAHELVHRTDSPASVFVGRQLLALSWDTAFAIEHVHGHHRTVGTKDDPATSRRGETAYAFVARSTIGQNRAALAFERARLARKGLPFWSPSNRFLTGQIASAVLTLAAVAIAGPVGALVFLACAAQGKIYLELVNYIEHYGLVREPGARVEGRHSWNCARLVSSALLYNLPRHSNHHRFATTPFWRLEVEPDAPTTPYGYKVMILVALVPPLWRRLMHPRLADWDRRLASEGERTLLARDGVLFG